MDEHSALLVSSPVGWVLMALGNKHISYPSPQVAARKHTPRGTVSHARHVGETSPGVDGRWDYRLGRVMERHVLGVRWCPDHELGESPAHLRPKSRSRNLCPLIGPVAWPSSTATWSTYLLETKYGAAKSLSGTAQSRLIYAFQLTLALGLALRTVPTPSGPVTPPSARRWEP